MVYLLKVLSDIAPKPSITFPLQICPKPKVKLGPTKISYSAPPSSLDIATARNHNQFGLTEMGLQTLCCLLHKFRSHQNMKLVPPSLLGQLSVLLITQIGPTELV